MAFPLRSRTRPGPSRTRGAATTINSISPVQLPFSDNFTRANGPLGSPWTGLHQLFPTQQDPVGIVSNAVADIQHIDDDYLGSTVTTGWRGGAFVDTTTSTDFEVVCNIEAGSIAALTTGGPMVLVNPDTNDLGLGCWHNPSFNYIELGTISIPPGAPGNTTTGFRFLDVNWCPDLSTAYELKMRVVGTQVAVYLNGNLFCGPVTIPTALQGARRHGIQTDDLLTSSANTPTVSDCTITANSTPLDTYTGAVITDANRIGTATKFTSGTTIAVPYPATVTAGDILICVVGNEDNRTISTPAGWSVVLPSGGFGVIGAVFSKVATGSESGTLTVTNSGAVTSAAGVIFCAQNVSTYRPVDLAVTGNYGVSPLDAPAQNLIGKGRLVILTSFGSLDAAHTHPVEFSTIAETGAGGAGCKLKVSGQAPTFTGTDTPYTVLPAATVTASGQIIVNAQFQIYPKTHT